MKSYKKSVLLVHEQTDKKNYKQVKEWLTELKNKICSVQIKAATVVNSALIEFYWDLGKMISEKESVWGSKLIEQVAKD